jgi:hypothetical protein
LGYVAQRLRNARCDRAMSGVRGGISSFAFMGSENEVFHVCWCRDGQALGLTGLYSDEQLATAVFTDACGNIVHSPLAINERPLFIDFQGLTSQQLPERLIEMRNYDTEIVYPCLPELKGIPWQNRGWRGAFSTSNRL